MFAGDLSAASVRGSPGPPCHGDRSPAQVGPRCPLPPAPRHRAVPPDEGVGEAPRVKLNAGGGAHEDKHVAVAPLCNGVVRCYADVGHRLLLLWGLSAPPPPVLTPWWRGS